MAQLPRPRSVTLEGEYYHVRFRDPGDFEEIRTPAWATEAAQHVAAGATVRTGRRGGDGWAIQSVLIPADAGEAAARERAEEILAKIEGD